MDSESIHDDVTGDRMSDQTTTGTTSTERARSGSSLANPRRVRLGRDGRPLPAPTADEH